MVLLMFAVAADSLGEEIQLPMGGLVLNANLERAGKEGWTDGPVILMTHGTLAHGGMEIMRGLQAMFRDRGVSSLAINLSLGLNERRGMYDCATPHVHEHTDAVAEIGAWVEWIEGQGVSEVALLGHSRGGNQVARFAAQRHDPKIKAVILVAPSIWREESALADHRKRYGKELGPALERARALVRDGKGDTLMEGVNFLYCENTRVSAAAFLSYYEPDPRMDTPRLIPHVDVPVLVFAGSEDTTIGPGLIEEVEPLADGDRVRLVVIEGADHFFRDLYSEDIADAVADRLGGS
jgi:pimeloyl-ACP methyl ester carboxylesterase